MAAASSAAPAAARASAATLDATFTAPNPPNPVTDYPSSWSAYTALISDVLMPYDVIVCNRELGPLPDVQGFPNLAAVPSDATMLLLYIQDPVSRDAVTISLADAISLDNGRAMAFSDLGRGDVGIQGFRTFGGWYVSTSGDLLYSIGTYVYVGPDAANEWADVQPIVDSIRLPS